MDTHDEQISIKSFLAFQRDFEKNEKFTWFAKMIKKALRDIPTYIALHKKPI